MINFLKTGSRSRICICAAYSLIFIFILILNIWSPFVADDFVYMSSFETGEWIKSVSQIFPSIYRHSFTMNGRVISSGLEQLMLLLPRLAFDFVNAGIFTLTIFLMDRLCAPEKQRSVLRIGFLFAAAFTFLPVFGQTSLWISGSVNYLWGVCVALLFLTPYIRLYLLGKTPDYPTIGKILFVLFSYTAGFYTEIASLAALGTAVVLLSVSVWRKKCRPSCWLWISVLACAGGYVCMMLMPAELGAKAGGFQLKSFLSNCITITRLLKSYFWPLFLIWIVLFFDGVRTKLAKERLFLSCLLLLAGCCGGYTLAAAAYIADRCFCLTAFFLTLSCGMLLKTETDRAVLVCKGLAGLALAGVCILAMWRGSADIYRTGRAYDEREELIAELRDAGERDLVLDVIHADTEYSIFWDVRDLCTETSQDWPNLTMASYYGVNSILGK